MILLTGSSLLTLKIFSIITVGILGLLIKPVLIVNKTSVGFSNRAVILIEHICQCSDYDYVPKAYSIQKLKLNLLYAAKTYTGPYLG